MSKVYFITGTSSGFGKALAETALEQGERVILAARKIADIEKLAAQYEENALAVKLEVTNADDRQSAIQAALEKFGRVDVLANIAGVGSLGALEEFSSAQIRQQFEVNCFGVLEMTREILPVMREQRSGHILNLTSIGGLAAVGAFALYCATKFAVEGFSEALRDEVKPLGIKVTLVEPGAFRTEFAGASNVRPEKAIDDYKPVIEPIQNYLYGNDGKQLGDPRKAAEAMIQVVESENPPLRLMLGADAFGLWEQKRAAIDAEFSKWRKVGTETAFNDVEVLKIGG